MSTYRFLKNSVIISTYVYLNRKRGNLELFIKIFLSFFILLFMSGNSFAGETLTISAASDLRYAFEDLVKVFAANHKNSNIQVIYGSSGKSFNQIINGAPYDIFFSADISYPKLLKDKHLTLTEPK